MQYPPSIQDERAKSKRCIPMESLSYKFSRAVTDIVDRHNDIWDQSSTIPRVDDVEDTPEPILSKDDQLAADSGRDIGSPDEREISERGLLMTHSESENGSSPSLCGTESGLPQECSSGDSESSPLGCTHRWEATDELVEGAGDAERY